jgi:hypothetical protein
MRPVVGDCSDRSRKFRHEAVGLDVGICAKRNEYLKCFHEINAPFAKLNPRDHSVFPSERDSQIPLSHVCLAPEHADVLAKDFGKQTVGRFQHALIFGTGRLASKMRA